MSAELSFIRTNDNDHDDHRKPTEDKSCNWQTLHIYLLLIQHLKFVWALCNYTIIARNWSQLYLLYVCDCVHVGHVQVQGPGNDVKGGHRVRCLIAVCLMLLRKALLMNLELDWHLTSNKISPYFHQLWSVLCLTYIHLWVKHTWPFMWSWSFELGLLFLHCENTYLLSHLPNAQLSFVIFILFYTIKILGSISY